MSSPRTPLPAPIRWAVSPEPVSYPEAVAAMEREVAAIAAAERPELIWLLEHPPLLTVGPRAQTGDLIAPQRFDVFATDRGGAITYHGPGQRIVYTMLDVRRRADGDVREFVRLMERCVIAALDSFGIAGRSDPSRPGVWVDRAGEPDGEAKIAALGFKVRRGISFHGIGLNVAPDLSAFAAIVPCGLSGTAVTSLAAMTGRALDVQAVDNALKAAFEAAVGPLVAAAPPDLGGGDSCGPVAGRSGDWRRGSGPD